MWINISQTNNKYSVSEDGQVKNNLTNHILKPDLNSKGYPRVLMASTRMTIHRLVALYYVSNPNNYPQINHIDGNKLNNHYSNLEWCTNAHNHQHSINTGLRKYKITAVQAKDIKDNKGILPAKDLALKHNIATISIYKIWSGDYHKFV